MLKAMAVAALCVLLPVRAAAWQGSNENLKRLAEESGRAFVSGDGVDARRLKILFPAAASRLKIPAPEPPTLER